MPLFNFGRRREEEQLPPDNVSLQSPEQSNPLDGMDGVNIVPSQSPSADPVRFGDGVLNGFMAINQPIGKKQVNEATQILQKYREGKANLQQRIIDNERWYKLRHWECMRDKKQEVQPVSGWLFNCIANKHADSMDNFPAPNVLPREADDQPEAEMLSSIIPVILEQGDFEQTYSDEQYYKLKNGTGVYGVFWDSSKLNGIGDISVSKVDLLNLFWEPGITDIQQSRNFFHAELQDNDVLVEKYPQLAGKLGSKTVDIAQYIADESIDTSDKSVVIDWYYHRQQDKKNVLHYCKYVNDEVLFATENDPNYQATGWYNHGLYPFVFDVLFPVEGMPTGFGYIDVGKDAQAYIDRGNQAILENMLANAKPRFFIRSDGAVKEEEFADTNKPFVHVDGNLGQDSIMPVQPSTFNANYITILQSKIDELKETTGNRDISTGGTSSGVTAASAIAAMQEAGSKLSRDANKGGYRAFRKVVLMIIELIRQFYDMPRCFRIIGREGAAKYVAYSNAGIAPQYQGVEMGVDMGYRLPLFDIEVSSSKASPYSKLSQNELAIQFYSAGFFNPAMGDQALACLEMMDFDRKQMVIDKIQQNLIMYQQLMMTSPMAQAGVVEGGEQEGNNSLGGDERTAGEASNTKNARERVANSTAP